MQKLIIFLFPLILFAACVSPRQEAPLYSRDIARVGDDLIVKEDFLRFRLRLEMAKYPENYLQAPENADELKQITSELLDKIITDDAIIAYGKKHNIEIKTSEVEKRVEEKQKLWNPKTFEDFLTEKNIPYSYWRQITENQVKVQMIMDAALSKDIKVSLSEVRNYYDKNDAQFFVPERVRVRHIVTDTLEKANDIYARLLDGENFAKLAINHSLSPDRAKGGVLDYFAKGTYPAEFDDACFKLGKGQLSPIVKSDYGYHIFKLLDRKPAGKRSFDEVMKEVEQKLFEEKLNKKYDAWIKTVRAEIPVQINQENLNGFVL